MRIDERETKKESCRCGSKIKVKSSRRKKKKGEERNVDLFEK